VLVTAASGGSSLFDRYRPFAILKPKNRKTEKSSGPREMADLGDEGLFWMDLYGLWLARILHGPVSPPCLCITTVLFEIAFKHFATNSCLTVMR
jgi:hypothetical protein